MLIFFDRPNSIALVEMPRNAKVTFKDRKTSQFEIVTTFEDNEWERLKYDRQAYKADQDNPPIDIYLSFIDIRAIV